MELASSSSPTQRASRTVAIWRQALPPQSCQTSGAKGAVVHVRIDHHRMKQRSVSRCVLRCSQVTTVAPTHCHCSNRKGERKAWNSQGKNNCRRSKYKGKRNIGIGRGGCWAGAGFTQQRCWDEGKYFTSCFPIFVARDTTTNPQPILLHLPNLSTPAANQSLAGVCYLNGSWHARIYRDGKRKHLGRRAHALPHARSISNSQLSLLPSFVTAMEDTMLIFIGGTLRDV